MKCRCDKLTSVEKARGMLICQFCEVRNDERKRIKRIIKQYHKKDECECKFTDNPLCYWKELLLKIEGEKE